MKRFSVIIVLVLFGFVFTQTQSAFAQEKPVVTAKANKKSYKPGTSGSITIRFKTAEKVKIPADQIEVSISGNNVTGEGLANVSGGEYLDPQTVSYKFNISSNAETGKSIPVKVTIKYGYCNYDTGICKRTEVTKTVSLKIK